MAGILGEKFEYKNPEEVLKVDNSVKVKIVDKNICERYTVVVLEKHGELKQKCLTWQDTILAKSGMRPVDPIVDATNYLMLLTGQPLHAFDYDKFVQVGGTDKPEIVAKSMNITVDNLYNIRRRARLQLKTIMLKGGYYA